MPIHLAIIALLSFPLLGHRPESQTQFRHFGAWVLRVSDDRFSDRLICQLSAHGVEYGRGALVFHLPRTVDTAAAVYRIDGGDPVDIRNEQLEMAHLGFAVEEDSLANPSGGLVRIPQARARSGHKVQIEAGGRGKIFTFKVDGLAAALDAADQAGCLPDRFMLQTTP